MRFGPVVLDQAEGAVLAHSLRALDRPYDMQMTYRIAKGTRLTRIHIDDLAAEGHETVVVAFLEAGDVPEDRAAERLAQAILTASKGHGLRASGAGAGRVNLYTTGCGVARVDAKIINAINAIDPMITIATVPDFHRVDADGMIATIKIISYAVPETNLVKACDIAQGGLRVAPPVFGSATLIETTVGPEAPSDKGRSAMLGRVQRMGMMLQDRVLVPHRPESLADAIQSATGEIVFVLTASATSDVHDVAPEAVRLAGGEIERFGMPVDPGNLLFLGRCKGRPVIGLPGCARSPALNGADWVLERIICGIDVTASDIAAMGVGGLLKEIPTRPMPRERVERG
ncbi:molybdopterin-binding protein [uncultured Shimia sp.]|uniref:molybdopterin-binding protein n=1 Tax=uncultured Shimia sp. TaxID=573152 RepID=UPI00261297D9|nr:molybdopterin-binding protein [uncultured Shimia sp.]